MNTLNVGEIIKNRRIELGITQEKLCEGICEPPTLSKIENGKHQPSKANFDAFMERLGISNEYYYSVISQKEYDTYKIKYKIIQANIRKEDEKTAEYIKELEKLVAKDDKINQQFLLRTKAVLAQHANEKDELILDMLEECLRLTHPKFSKDNIDDYLFSYEEIKILINIAVIDFTLQNKAMSISLLYQLMDYIEQDRIDIEERARTLPSICYNLSRFLSLENRKDEAIKITEKGIACCRKYGKTRLLAELAVNKGVVLYDIGEREESYKMLQQAYYTFKLMDNAANAQMVKAFVEENLNEKLD